MAVVRQLMFSQLVTSLIKHVEWSTECQVKWSVRSSDHGSDANSDRDLASESDPPR